MGLFVILHGFAVAAGLSGNPAAGDIGRGAAAFPADAVIQQCRQGGCVWRKTIDVRTVKAAAEGELKVERTFVGESEHGLAHEPPARYAPGIAITWEAAPVETYIFCSRKQPGIAFKDRWSGESAGWIGHLLDPFETYGYNEGSLRTYMRICHATELVADRDKVLRRLGYRPGTRNEQVDLKSPLDLPNPPTPERPR